MYQYNAFVTRVIDGDTFDVTVDLGFEVFTKTRLRLAHVNAYETRLGKRTTKAQKVLGLKAKKLCIDSFAEVDNMVIINTFKKGSKGKYGRWIAEVLLQREDGSVQDLAELLLKAKLAVKVKY